MEAVALSGIWVIFTARHTSIQIICNNPILRYLSPLPSIPPQINACATDMYFVDPTKTKQEWGLIFGGVMVRAE